MVDLLPLAHLQWFCDSVIPKSFTRVHFAADMNCKDVVFSICLMYLSRVD